MEVSGGEASEFGGGDPKISALGADMSQFPGPTLEGGGGGSLGYDDFPGGGGYPSLP